MTYRELFEAVIHDMTNQELAECINKNDLKLMAVFDAKLKGDTNEEKIRQLLESEVEY